MAQFELIGVGSPIMDLLARVPDEFLRRHVAGEKGGMVLVDHAEMQRLVSLLAAPPATATGGVWYEAGSQKNSGNNPALMLNAIRNSAIQNPSFVV